MIEKIMEKLFFKKKACKNTFTVIRNRGEKINAAVCAEVKKNETQGLDYTRYIKERGKIYAALFNACNLR